jgi:hypothetical protein
MNDQIAATEQRETTSGKKWVKGMASPNPKGRKAAASVTSVRGMLSRFVKRNLTPRKVQALYDQLTVKEKLQFLTECIPYILAKPSAGGADIDFNKFNDRQIDEMYEAAMSRITSGQMGAVA